jgi:hypothetical protein
MKVYTITDNQITPIAFENVGTQESYYTFEDAKEVMIDKQNIVIETMKELLNEQVIKRDELIDLREEK